MLSSLIGKEVRRITFSLLSDGKYYLIYSVIENLWPDMQDFDFLRAEEFVCKRASSSKSHSTDKIYFSIDWFKVTREFIENPTANYILNDGNATKVVCEGKYSRSPELIEDVFQTHDLFKSFPHRTETRSLTVWADRLHSMQSRIMDDNYFRKQYSQVSSDFYGIDLSLFPEFIGNINIINYNPYFKSVDWSISNKPPGIYATVDRRLRAGSLQIEFINKNKEGLFEYCATRDLDLSSRYHFWELPGEPDRLTVLVKDGEGNLVYGAGDMAFIRSFSLGMNVHSKIVSLQHRDGEREKVDKFASENFAVGEGRSYDIPLTSATQAFRLLENSLDFAFFNGSKDQAEKEQNRNRAKAFVKKIIANASNRCIIADPYFNLDDLSRYIFTMPQSDITVRIISSKEFLANKYSDKKTAAVHKKEATEIVAAINSFTEKIGGNIQFRLLTGTSPLHDRYIVADESVWLMGTSFNEIGKRACTIIKLPQASCRQIINMLDSWWSDSKMTISAEEYAKS